MSYPATFGKYLLLERVNVGGMAEVFKAKAFGVEGFERIIAIKRILPNMADDDEFINMFVDEARIAVQLSHANIVQIYELGKFEGQYYIAMEYVSGKDLRQILDFYRKRDELLPLPAAAYLASKICDGLDYAHSKVDPTGRPMNVIHRDVSPQNILVSFEGAVKITDFGIAKAEDRASKTQAGVLKGKFGYMSPEQVRGLDIDHRSDIFALGILMYEMLTGKRLFLGESDFSTLEKVRNAEVVPPSEHNPDIPPAFEAVLLKTLARERDQRYQAASDLHDDLQQFLIEDNTIFNTKRLAGLLQSQFSDSIEAEMQKMEEFARMAPLPSKANAFDNERSAGSFSGGSDENTMVFESGFRSSDDHGEVSTQVHSPGKGNGWGENSKAGPAPLEPTGSVVDAQPQRHSLQPQPSLSGGELIRSVGIRHTGAILIAVAAFVSLLILLLVLLTGTSSNYGTIVITSSPTTVVDVYLDNQLIGSRTPITKSDVSVGEHILTTKSTGFADRAYRFELAAGNPATIHVELAPPALAQSVGPKLNIGSEPPGATVYQQGKALGVTPFTLTHAGDSEKISFELRKHGYETVTRVVALQPDQMSATIDVTLRPTHSGGRIVVRSSPSQATASLGGSNQCVTPCELNGVDTTRNHTVEIVKEGFQSAKVPVAFNETMEVIVDETLSPQSAPRVIKDRPRQPKPVKKGKPSGRNGGTGSCGGSEGKLSVMTIGKADCKVTVGKSNLGPAPFFKKASPVGRCEVSIACPDGKNYRTTKTIKEGGDERVVVKPEDWQ